MNKYKALIFKTFSLFVSFSSLLATDTVNQPFVTCTLDGQLGNHFSLIATTLAYAWDHNMQPIFPELNRLDLNIAYNRDHLFFKLNNGPLPRPILNVYDDRLEGGWWDYKKPIPSKPDLCLKGVFFCWKHFHHHREKLLQVFAPTKDIQDYLKKKYGWLLVRPNTVSVHVRTYNKQYHSECFPFLGLEYYEKAMNLFPEDTIFVVFSDRINWCKHHFRRFNKAIVFVEGNNHLQDFFLMSMLKSHIIANSSFSWWAAYLNKNPKKIVVTPKWWYRMGPNFFVPNEKTSHVLFPDWIVLDPNLNTPYPEDMKRYDTYSQSIDTQ